MTCTRCGSWQSEAGAGNRFCSNCGSTLPVAPDDQPTYVHPGHQSGQVRPTYAQPTYAQPGYDQPTYAQSGYDPSGYDPYGEAGSGPVGEPAPRRDRDWVRHPGTWIIAATALLVAGIVLAAVIVSSGGSDDTRRTAAGANPSTPSASPVATASTAPAPVQTVIVVPAAPGTPAVTHTVTVAPHTPDLPSGGAGTGQFADASEIDSSYFTDGSTASFDSPSHNIGCRLVDNGSQAQCTITDYNFSEPGHDCSIGAGVLMDVGASPTIDCIHNAPYSGATVLGYGESMSFGGFSCVSRQSGVTCLDSYGSGFTLSRELYTAY